MRRPLEVARNLEQKYRVQPQVSHPISLLALFSVAELYEYALRPEHIESPDPSVGPTTISDTGALSCMSGSKMGRVPKEKRIVYDDMTKDVSTTILF